MGLAACAAAASAMRNRRGGGTAAAAVHGSGGSRAPRQRACSVFTCVAACRQPAPVQFAECDARSAKLNRKQQGLGASATLPCTDCFNSRACTAGAALKAVSPANTGLQCFMWWCSGRSYVGLNTA